MKFDEYLAQYLYEKKTLHLQSIGTFELDKSVSLPQQSEKEIYYPIEGLSFHYNPKDVTSEEVIFFLIKRLGKIEPLIRSDLNSYLSNVRQFINIGKPYTIEGIGTLHSNNQGIYEFTPGHFLPSRAEVPVKRDKSDNFVRHEPQKNSGGKGWTTTLVVVAVLVVLAAAGWAAYEFLIKPGQQQTPITNEDVTEVSPDSQPGINTVLNSGDSLGSINTPTSDIMNYKMVFEITTSKQRAYKRTAFLRSVGSNAKIDSLVTPDSTQYRMYIPLRLHYSDTLRVKDSLAKFFNRRVIITQ